MNSEVKALPSKKNMSNPSWIQSFQKHYELIFAILSGVFILSGWLFTKNEATTAGIVFYILAYIIGGYAKAKEGIEDTIEEKELFERKKGACNLYEYTRSTYPKCGFHDAKPNEKNAAIGYPHFKIIYSFK